MVEFALILPIFLVLILGMVQYGIILNTRISLFHVSRAAGRFAAVNATKPNIDSTIRSRTVTIAQGYGLTILPANITLTPGQNTNSAGTTRQRWGQMTMTIKMPVKNRMFLPDKLFPGTRFEARMPYSNDITITNTMIME